MNTSLSLKGMDNQIKEIHVIAFTVSSDVLLVCKEIVVGVHDFQNVIDFDFTPRMSMKELCVPIAFRYSSDLIEVTTKEDVMMRKGFEMLAYTVPSVMPIVKVKMTINTGNIPWVREFHRNFKKKEILG
ncbi:hypothetical protein LIER_37036 [Lithospermum erythrorhizon]|uniref:Uncharacterized protein n=1 Tax=Lithospermum erythrorhizon TaxID=34254 RepID=A0AAV3PFC6_LITER